MPEIDEQAPAAPVNTAAPETTPAPTPQDAVASKLDALSAFLGKDEIEALKKESGVAEQAPATPAPTASQPGAPEGQDAAPETAPEENGAPEVKKPEAAATPKETKSVLGLKKPGDKKPDIVIEKPEEILGVLNQKFGLALKETKDLPKFIEISQEWRAKAQKADDLETKNKEIIGFLESLPDDLLESLRIAEVGGNYREAFDNKPKFDYNIAADKQDIKALVNTFYPGKFTEEDFTDEEPSEVLQMAISSSKDKFTVEKQAHDTKRVQIMQKADQALKAQTAAAQNSVSRLAQSFPDMEKDNFTKVKTAIEGGPNHVLSLFYNKDGTAKPEAAELLTMAMYGKEEIDRMMQVSAHITETKINEDLISRGADTKKPVQTTGITDKISEQDQAKIRELDRIAGKQKRTF
jgi:hypothetical protein